MPMKEPLHPGKIAKDLLMLSGYESAFQDLNFYNAAADLRLETQTFQKFLDCEHDVDHVLAYKLANCIEKTDITFWLKLQEDYDNYKGGPVGFKTAEEWESLEHRKLNPKVGDIIIDGVNRRTYRGNGVWQTTLLHENIEK